MSDVNQQKTSQRRDSLRNAAPGARVTATPPPPTSNGLDSSPTVSDKGHLPRQQPPSATSATLPIGGATGSSYSFSFCGSDAFNMADTEDDTTQQQPSLALQQQQQQLFMLQQQQQQQSAQPVSSAQSNSSQGAASNGLPAQAPTMVLNPVSLSAANLEYFYGIPTPSAPARSTHETSSASNCSSSHHQHHHHGSASVDSNQTGFSNTTPSAADPFAPNPSGVQKDVLAFMAAEQQQQKFVLQQRNVYMSGLPVDFRPSAFRAMCEVFGRIESSKLCMESDDANRCRGFGFVLFYDVDSANSCIASLNGKVMQGKTLQVRRADLSAAPQPLNPVTQRNRTGSGLVTPPTLPPISQAPQNTNHSNHSAGVGFPLFTPHPPGSNTSSSNNNNASGSNSGANNTSGAMSSGHVNTIGSSMVVSTLPFTFATPTMMGAMPAQNTSTNVNANAVATASSSSNNNTTMNNNNNLLPQKGSATNSSFLYGGPSASSSLGNSSSPTVVYQQNGTLLPAMRNGVPVMQMFAPCPPGTQPTMLTQQQQQQLLSHSSMHRNDAATSHATTPSSVASSNMNLGFVPAAQFGLQGQQQQQQPQFLPQPPMQPSMQPQRPLTPGTNLAFYQAMDSQGNAMAQPFMTNASAIGSNGGAAMMSTGNMTNMYAPNMVMQEYLAAAGLDPNASNSNIYYLFPQ